MSRGRFVAALAILLLIPVATEVPALAALALVTLVWLALHAYELVWWREARARSRSMLTSSLAAREAWVSRRTRFLLGHPDW
ncbi:MAG: hypothetical protein ACXVRZ_02985 [Gaiellaceae bacterium]